MADIQSKYKWVSTRIYAYLGMYSIVIEAEFCTVFMEDPVKDDPENAAAGAARVRAMREAVFIFEIFMFEMR